MDEEKVGGEQLDIYTARNEAISAVVDSVRKASKAVEILQKDDLAERAKRKKAQDAERAARYRERQAKKTGTPAWLKVVLVAQTLVIGCLAAWIVVN
jgi:hypothetical protein